MKEFGGKIGQKYAGIDLKGRRLLQEGGQIKEFKGFPETLKDRFNVSLRFNETSEAVLRERIQKPFEIMEQNLGLKLFLFGRDFPAHTTVLEGFYEDPDKSERDNFFSLLRGYPEVQEAIGRIKQLEIIYKYLLSDHLGNSLLTSVEIPDDIFEARDRFTEIYTDCALKPLGIANILHITLARISSLPKENLPEKLKEFETKLRKLRQDISREPLKLQVGDVFVGNAWDLIHSACIS